LTQLLSNKFKFKFHVSADEPELERIVDLEVNKLLNTGKATERNLVELQTRLTKLISEARQKGTKPLVASSKPAEPAEIPP
jgi:copper homeostasis protein CutC